MKNNQVKPSFEEIKITLEPDQRFFYQMESDGAIVLVDQIEIFAYAKQMILSGTHFAVDYEDKTIEKIEDRSHIVMETNMLHEVNDGEV
ncbi:hypothetical protein E6C60_3049 [Paenibacillus algicola]|uniref:Uncharacterized protein n=1 Tax=Paenibacillus algicola TaxID=2565926 RepID=A0A4P8XPP9_9BACL|nr:hypothetical protein [Paenibacillus algicola]QCT03760.1 hypothetical protein E6C60_3049 [Paenibacillus algicola]